MSLKTKNIYIFHDAIFLLYFFIEQPHERDKLIFQKALSDNFTILFKYLIILCDKYTKDVADYLLRTTLCYLWVLKELLDESNVMLE